MKKALVLLSSVAVIGLAGSAVAADIPARMPTKAPAAASPAFYNWTGIYFGGHVGYGWGASHLVNITGTAGFPVGTVSDQDYDGIIGGGQVGLNYQFAPNWVVGVEGDYSWSNIDGDHTSVSPITGGTLATHTEVNWIATATGRLGYALNNWLFYAKGGAAWADYEGSAVGKNAAGVVGITTSGGETRDGWTVGAGIEYGWSNWSAKVEYNYLDFGTESISRFASLNLIGAPNPSLRDSDAHIHLVKFGINYRFNWPQ